MFDEVVGPDVQTTCGSPSNLLQVGASYIAGIGSVCSTISEWANVDSYRDSELQLLRDLRGEACGMTTTTSGVTTTTSGASESTTRTLPSTPVVFVPISIPTAGAGVSSLTLYLLILPIFSVFLHFS